MQEAIIVSAARTAVGKAKKGTLANYRPEDMGAAAVTEALKRAAGLDPQEIDDVIIGCAMPEGEQGLNLGRNISLRAGLSHTVAAQTVNRFCSSGVQTIALGAQQIMTGMGEVIVAGGVESMSAVPMTGFQFRPNPWLVDNMPELYISMGLTAENVAQEFNVSREDQDQFGARSHQRALAAIAEGKFKDEIVPLEVEHVALESGVPTRKTVTFDTDEGPRPGSTPEVLSKLRPVFKAKGTVTAGNASQMSDGAAAVVVMSREKAETLGLKPMARFVSFGVGGVRARSDGHRPGGGHSQGPQICRLDHERHRSNRTQRGFCGPGPGRHPGDGDGFGKGQRQRRGYCPGASFGGDRG